MITFEIRVNGSVIAAITCVNRGLGKRFDLKRGPQCNYEWTAAVFPQEVNEAPRVEHGTLAHFRGDGAIALARAIFSVLAPKRTKRFDKPPEKATD